MEEYTEETGAEPETPEAEIPEESTGYFPDTVSGNDAGPVTASGPENSPSEGNGQGELLERLDALVEVLTPGEEETEEEHEAEILPSETETATLELLEKIYAETSAGRTADSLYYEAWTESRKEERETAGKLEKLDIYTLAVLVALLFLCACIAGIQVARTIWERFK